MFTPRLYQIELVERSLSTNTIVCVNSEANKNFIILSYIKEIILKQAIIRNENIAVVLLPDEHITHITEALRRQLNVEVENITEENESTNWNEKLQQTKVLVMTPDMFLSPLQRKSELCKLIKVLVADNCHQVINENCNLKKIIKIFDDEDIHPYFLGTTCSLLADNRSAELLKQDIETMESVFHARAETATDLIGGDQLQMSMISEQIILCGNTQNNSSDDVVSIANKIAQIVEDAIQWLNVCQLSSSSKLTVSPAEDEPAEINKFITVEQMCEISRNMLARALDILHVLGVWCVYKYVTASLKQIHKYVQILKNSNHNILTTLLLQHLNCHMRSVYTLCHRHRKLHKKTPDSKLLSSKVVRLLQVLREFKPSDDGKKNENKKNDSKIRWEDSDGEDGENMIDDAEKQSNTVYSHTSLLCGIVIVNDIHIAMMLHHLLKAVHDEDKELQHVFSGHSIEVEDIEPFSKTPISETNKSKEEEVLRCFRDREINFLVSSSELEEAADLPKCNLVVRFDVPQTFRSYIKSKSRNQGNGSSHIIMVNENEKSTFMLKLQEFKRIEQILRCSSPLELPEPIDDGYFDDVDSEWSRNDELIPPYFTGPHSCVTMQSAIHVINRYCARLPNDTFTHLTTQCSVVEEIVNDTVLYKCVLQLPINSRLRKPIHGPFMPTVNLAQKAVAMETCKWLHKVEELDDHFMPISKETIKYEEELDKWPTEISQTTGRPGTTKRRQTYDKEVPAILHRSLPTAGVPLFIYKYDMTLASKLPDDLNVKQRKLHAPEDTTRSFGFLTTKLLPKTCPFPIFTRSGEETVDINIVQGYIVLQEHQIKMVRSFHQWLFSDMLRIDRPPLVFKPELSRQQFYVVVVNKTSHSNKMDIDWPFLCKLSSGRQLDDRMTRDPWFRHQHRKANGKTSPYKFRRSKYEDGVVVAKYRSPEQPNRFYVAEVNYDLNPQSSFPSSEYQSFQQYYKIKYSLDITCNQQPLLDVDPTPSRLNLLTPRYINQKGKIIPHSSLEKKRAKYENLTNRQILIPELCILHMVPASLWRKAFSLPSIIYRMNQLLIAEEFRNEITQRSGISIGTIYPWNKWPSLDFGWDNQEDEIEQIVPDQEKSNCEENSRYDKIKEPGLYVNQDKNPNDKNDMGLKEMKKDKFESENQTEIDEIKLNPGTNEIGQPEANQTIGLDQDKQNSKESEEEKSENDEQVDRNEIEEEKSDKIEEKYSEVAKPEVEDTSDSSTSGLSSDYNSDDYKVNFDLSDSDMVLKVEKDSLYQTKKKKTKKKRKKRSMQMKTRNVPESEIAITTDQYSIVKESLKNFKSENIGPSPSLVLQALTLSNASDGFNLERLEMLGDSFLKHAVTIYLYCTYPEAHEGKLSYMRSKKVSNYNLYRIGLRHRIPGKMSAVIFDPIVNWLPPGYVVGSGNCDEEDLNDEDYESDVEIGVWNAGASTSSNKQTLTDNDNQEKEEEEEEEIYDESEINMIDTMLGESIIGKGSNGIHGGSRRPGAMYFTDHEALKKSQSRMMSTPTQSEELVIDMWTPKDSSGKVMLPSDPLMLDLHTQHSLADKSIADCVEAVLGSYLTTCGDRAAQILLCYFGLQVLPTVPATELNQNTVQYGHLKAPQNLLVDESEVTMKKLEKFALHLRPFENEIGYTFKNKAYLVQAFTHASYYYNDITDCYQRVEFLGDAILDYLITSRLFNEQSQVHSPGALTDLRSALVNNTIFASLAIQYNYHKYFKSLSPKLYQIIDDFVCYQSSQDEAQGMDAHLGREFVDAVSMEEDSNANEASQEMCGEDIEVPKALGDIFESVAGAIYMDSGMDLDEVWRVYGPMMDPLIEKFSKNVPRAPVRELLEMEPETVKFSWGEKQCDGKVRVSVEVIGKGTFKGIGRNYRLAKAAAARRALRYLKFKQ